jgi:tRNA A37 methylthiotransferase MiaB
MQRPLVLIAATNPYGDAAASYESDLWLRTRSGHLASFSNLVRLVNPVGATQPRLENPGKAARSLAGYYLESFLKVRGWEARAAFDLEQVARWSSAEGEPPPVAVAVSTTFISTVAELTRTLRAARERVGPAVPLIVGGTFVWKQHLWGPDRFAHREDLAGRPEALPLFASDADPILKEAIYVAHEFGEHTLLTLLEACRRGAAAAEELAGIPNLVLWTDAGWRHTGAAAEPIDLDRDFTRWDLVDEMPPSWVPVRTSVGCPYGCEFCDFVAVHPRLKLRSPESIVAELKAASARGGNWVSFVDDNALSTPRRARALAEAITSTGLGLRWGGYLRADAITGEIAPVLAASGLRYAWCGIESGDPDMLRRMRKRLDVEAARNGIDALLGEGIQVLTTFVLGFPGETRASIETTAAFLNGLRADARGSVVYLAFPFQLAPSSPVDAPERRREFGLTGSFGTWRHATMTSEEVHQVWAPHLFRAADVSYEYYGGDDSALWSSARRRAAALLRKSLTVAFLDGAPDDVVQARFADLHAALRFTPSAPPDWRAVLGGRELQPSAAQAAARRAG